MGVSAGNTTGTSAYTLATPMVVGAAYKLPFKETFAKAGYAYGFWASEGNGWGYQMSYAGVQASTTEDANGDGGSAEIKTYYEDCVSLVSGKIALGSVSKPVFKYSQKTTTTTGAIRVFVIKADGSRETLATENLSGYADGGKWAARSYDFERLQGSEVDTLRHRFRPGQGRVQEKLSVYRQLPRDRRDARGAQRGRVGPG